MHTNEIEIKVPVLDREPKGQDEWIVWLWITNGPWFISANHEVFKFIKFIKFLVTFLLVYEFVNLEFFFGGGEVQSDPPSSRNFQGESPSLICTLLNNLFTTTAAAIYHALAFICLVRSWLGNKHPKQMGEHAVVNIYLLKMPNFLCFNS